MTYLTPHSTFTQQGQASSPGRIGSSFHVFTLPASEGAWSSENHSAAVARHPAGSPGLGGSPHSAMDGSCGCEPSTACV